MISEVKCCDNVEYMAQFPDEFFDLAIVDPQYGIGDIRQARSRNVHRGMKWNNAAPGKDYFDELYRLSKHQIIWGCNYYTDHIKSTGRLIHDKTGGGKKRQLPELSDADIASHSFGVNIKIFHYLWQGNAQGEGINWNNSGPDSRIHPTQKPISLYRWQLKRYAKPGFKILDTHMGSQSLRIASDIEGFDFWGCELDPDYYREGCARFNLHKQQATLF